jgi:hypothetical protein
MAYSRPSTYPVYVGFLQKGSRLQALLSQLREGISGRLECSAWKFSQEKTPTAQIQIHMYLFSYATA